MAIKWICKKSQSAPGCPSGYGRHFGKKPPETVDQWLNSSSSFLERSFIPSPPAVPVWTDPETIFCYPCNMNFRVEKPRNQLTPTTKRHDCGRLFWHTVGHGSGPAKVGVWPEGVEAN